MQGLLSILVVCSQLLITTYSSGEDVAPPDWLQVRLDSLRKQLAEIESRELNRTRPVTLPSGKKWRAPDPSPPALGDCVFAPFKYEQLEILGDDLPVLREEARTQLGAAGLVIARRVLNPCVWQRYLSYRDWLTAQAGDPTAANETFLFSPYKDITRLKYEGFDQTRGLNFTINPSGLYFMDASYDFVAKRSWFTYLSRVALGKVYYMDPPRPMTAPPPGYQSIAWSSRTSNLTFYVVPSGEQTYPEFQVQY